MIGAVAPRILAAGDTALLVELGDAVSEAASAAVQDLDARIAATPPAGVVETVPALRTLLVEYDPLRTSHARLRGDLLALLQRPAPVAARQQPRSHTIPVVYDGPDLDAVAAATGLDRDAVIRLHRDAEYRVAMVGNLPGLPYLLGLDPRLRVPRRDDPRDAVPAGSVAIAGDMSCIYPDAGPGGWNLIGRTDAPLFAAHRDPPSLLLPGDRVRFVEQAQLSRTHSVDVDGGARRPALYVRDGGLLTTVQDGGRHGWQRIGVPVCGALDREWLHVANLLCGNAPDEAALEITHSGPLLEVMAHSVRIAAAGDVELQRIAADGTATDLQPWRSAVLQDGERLQVGRVRGGLRAVIAVEGGAGVDPLLGSRSTCLRAHFGGVQGRPLHRAWLPLRRDYAGHHPDMQLDGTALHDAQLTARGESPIRVVLGPQQDAVTPDSLDALLTTRMLVSHRSDRTGLRLDGLRLRHGGAAEIDSEGCAAGSVQVPGGGQPIVLLADRGTTGGYPKVATVASVDLPRLARLRPGDTVRLEAVDVAGAEALRRERERTLDALAAALRPVPGR